MTQAMGCLCESLRYIYRLQRLSFVYQAAIVVVQEAGGSVTSRSLLASERSHVDSFTLTPDVLMGREFLAIRAISATQGETSREAQLRLSKELYETVGDTTPMLRR